MESRIDRVRRLRRDWMRAEARLWLSLRNRQLDGFKFRRQFPVGRYFADFACLETKLIVELDGGQHPAATVCDEARTKASEQAGFRVLRFWNRDVTTELDGVLQEISFALNAGRS
jgi:very-short-patch-repair endonuclease